MNNDFNQRAGELFGSDVKNMLEIGDNFAGRYMDDNSSIGSVVALARLNDTLIVKAVRETAEKIYLYNIFCKKFINHPSNRDEKPYDNYIYGFVPYE